MYHEFGHAKQHYTIKWNAPSRSPPPTPTDDASTPMPHHNPPTLTLTSPPPRTPSSRPDQIGGGICSSMEFLPPSYHARTKCDDHHLPPFKRYHQTNSLLRLLLPHRHHTPFFTKKSNICPPISPYLAFKTRYQSPSLSTDILQHHFPNKDKLKNPNLLTPNPPSSFGKQMDSHFTQASIPQNFFKNRFSRGNYTCGGLEKGKKVNQNGRHDTLQKYQTTTERKELVMPRR